MDEKVKELYLAHHGVKGQKWGIRRYQNPDGTLTAEGRAKYGGKIDYTVGGESKAHAFFSGKGQAGIQMKRVRQAQATANLAKDRFDKGDKEGGKELAKTAYAKGQMMENYEAYTRHSSTAKLVMQNLLLTPFAATQYRTARASGEGRLSSLLETGGILGSTIALLRNKKRYGAAIL